MGKVIIMSTQPQPLPPVPAGSEAPLTASDFRNLAATINIFRSLGGVEALEATTKSHTENIEQLTQWVSAIPELEKDVAQNMKDLNELGKRHDRDIHDLQKISHTVRTLGAIALSGIGVLIFVYIYHHLIAPYLK
jgi:hypothetical protein